jgi:hypothetical protein
MKRNAVTCLLLAGLGAAVLGAAAPAAAQVIEQQAAPPKPENWHAMAGIRTTLVRSAGYDPFSTTDVLTQFSAAIQRVMVRSDAFVFAAGAVTEFGLTSAQARSAPSELQAWRLSVAAEGRYQPWQRGYGFVRVAPGVLGMSAQIRDASAPNGGTLQDTFQVLSADVSGGAAARLGPPANPVAIWMAAEAGYSWAGSHHLMLAPSAAARDQPKLAPLDLGTIEPRGAFFRLSLALAY